MIVWLLTGIWHGASWNFVVWGLYFGVLLILEKLFLLRLLEKLPAVFRHVYAMLLVMLGWAIFSFDSLKDGLTFLRALFGGNGQPLWDNAALYLLYTTIALLLIAAVGSTPLPQKRWGRLNERLAGRPAAISAVETCLVAAGMLLCVAFLVDASVLPEDLPKYAPVADQGALLLRMQRALGAGIIFCDPTQAYLSQADRQQLFFRTDHHWTVYGAFAAYQAWAQATGVTPLKREDFTARAVSSDFLGTLYSKANLPWIQPEKLEVFEPKQKIDCTITANNG